MSSSSSLSTVRICGADFGPAPVTLPSAQVAQLVGPGAVLALLRPQASTAGTTSAVADDAVPLSGPVAAGITWQSDGSVIIAQNGIFVVSNSNSSSDAGSQSSQQSLQQQSESSRRAFRQAQYLCAIIGTLMLNLMFWLDTANRLVNAKDFMINFASDIIAVGSVLIITDLLIARDVALEEVGAAVAASGGGIIAFAQEFGSRMWNGPSARGTLDRRAVAHSEDDE